MLNANLISTGSYTAVEKEKLDRALNLVETTINGEKFKQAVLNFETFQFVKYKCGLFKRSAISLHKYSNTELYEILMKGRREENGNGYMDLKLTLGTGGSKSAIGFTSSNNVITTHRSAFNRMSETSLAAHITHEWTHTMGFEHSFSKRCDSTRNCLSVPYAIGNIIEVILTGKCWYGCRYETLNR